MSSWFVLVKVTATGDATRPFLPFMPTEGFRTGENNGLRLRETLQILSQAPRRPRRGAWRVPPRSPAAQGRAQPPLDDAQDLVEDALAIAANRGVKRQSRAPGATQ